MFILSDTMNANATKINNVLCIFQPLIFYYNTK